ncbi:cytochrome c [Pedobacter gandavensis]|uniref:c-type cytochrome n=1 Tax=Pedobacter TaxID=84567 RepID=UPI000705AC05|nr:MULTISPECIES: cytochrome c [Pedobacter]ALL07292.1 copper oxidase [Pedobacter sp. PACM 27299]MBC8984314.1 cytochrome c [Pedobacter sp. N36a]WGQ09463.1 cytochrome c [Pedobacter gandavensis]
MRKLLISIPVLFTFIMMIYSCQSADQVTQDLYYVSGRDYYIKYCQNCHGAKGEGLGALAPPLTDTVFLKENRNKLACFIKNGMSEPITIHGKKYEEKMPDFQTLGNIDIAKIVVYITNSFGNKQGMYPLEQANEDLKKCK